MGNEISRVAIIGGGIIGGMCAWYLRQAGMEVTVVDRQRFGSGCSHGNCGYVSPSHVMPLPHPGAISNAMSMMLRPNSALRVKLLQFNPSLWYWLWRFALRCNQRDAHEAAVARHALLQSSWELYHELIEQQNLQCEWQTQGLMFVFQSKEGFEHYAETNRWLSDEFGVKATGYDGEQLTELEPALKPGLGGAWHYEADRHLRPDRLVNEVRQRLESLGVQFVEPFEARELRREQGKAKAVLGAEQNQVLEADAFVVTTGAWTPQVNKLLGMKLPIQPGKGYSLTMAKPAGSPKIPMIFEEHRVAVTPMESGYRLGSMMEFAGYDTSISPKIPKILRTTASLYLHDPYADPVEEEWFGWRPMTWDGKPIIDRTPSLENVWVAAGHNMLGLSMAPATGKLIAEMIQRKEPHLEVRPYRIDRF